VVVVVWQSNQHSRFVLCLLYCLCGEYTCLFIMFDSVMQSLSNVRFVMPVCIKSTLKNDLDYFLWLIAVFQYPAHNLQKSFTINQWHWWKAYISKVPFEGENSPDIMNLKRGNPKHIKYFRFQKIIPFFQPVPGRKIWGMQRYDYFSIPKMREMWSQYDQKTDCSMAVLYPQYRRLHWYLNKFIQI